MSQSKQTENIEVDSQIINNSLDDRIAATYLSKDAAKQAKEMLVQTLDLDEKSVKIIKPDDKATGKKLEGDSKSIGQELLAIHLIYPVIGLIIGIIIAFLLVNYGPLFVSSRPTFTYIAFISPGIFIGIFYAGLRSLKPEHDEVNMHTVAAKHADYWTVLVKTQNINISQDEIYEEIQKIEGLVRS